MDALLLVDVQNDFMPYGALPVADGDAVVPVANRLAGRFYLVVATQDWHPADHGSFASNQPGHAPGDLVTLGAGQQMLWPDHCVQNTPGASFHSGLQIARVGHVVRKGTDRTVDSYSGFYDNDHRSATGLDELLSARGVERITICGLATDYCVKFTALDARTLGYDVRVVVDGCRAVDVEPGDGERALEQMRGAGCVLVDSGERA